MSASPLALDLRIKPRGCLWVQTPHLDGYHELTDLTEHIHNVETILELSLHKPQNVQSFPQHLAREFIHPHMVQHTWTGFVICNQFRGFLYQAYLQIQ